MRRWIFAAALPLALGGVACNGDDTDTDTETDTDVDPFDAFADADLTDAEVVTSLVQNASAPNMYTLSVLFGAALEQGDGVCPMRSETDGVITYTGDCTDGDGDVWVGSAKVTRTGENSGRIEYFGLGRTGPQDCGEGGSATATQLFTGSVVIEESGAFTAEMEGEGTDVDDETCAVSDFEFRLEYEGLQNEVSQSVTAWSGSGRFADSRRGKVSATTTDEIVDDQGCDHEAESGTTTMEAGGHTAVITYDGAVDCDPESTVTWTLDGNAMGELVGVQCGPAVVAGAIPVGLAGLVVLGLRRRRRED